MPAAPPRRQARRPPARVPFHVPRVGAVARRRRSGGLTLPAPLHRVAADPSPPDRCPMNRPLTNFQTRDAEALLHPYTDAVALRATGALVIERGEGVRVWDQSGRSYIDGLAGLWCCGLGFGNAELVEAARHADGEAPLLPPLRRPAATSPASSSPRRSRSSLPAGWRGCSTSRAAPRRTTPRSSSPGTMNNALGRPAKKKIISRSEGLPWRHHRRRLADRPAQQPPRLRPAARHRAPHRDPALLERRPTGRDRGRLRPPPRRRARRADRGRGPRHRRRLHRRAGDGRRRRHRAARGLLRGRSTPSAAGTTS